MRPIAIGVLLLGCAVPAFPIVIQSVGAPGYVTGNNNFTGVVAIYFQQGSGTYICSGALFSGGADILTAGHCVAGSSNFEVVFFTPSGETVVGVSQSYLDPLWGTRPGDTSGSLPPQYDVGVLKLAGLPPADAARYGLDTTGNDVYLDSTLVDLVGYGIGGSPATGSDDYGVGTRRHAVNTVAGTICGFGGTNCQNTPVPTPDDPIELLLNLGESYQGSNTPCFNNSACGLPNAGDSGGPLLVGNNILGVTSFGNLPRPGPPDYSPVAYPSGTYVAGYTNLTNPQIASWVDSFLVPDPSTWLLMLLGCAGLLVRSKFVND